MTFFEYPLGSLGGGGGGGGGIKEPHMGPIQYVCKYARTHTDRLMNIHAQDDG